MATKLGARTVSSAAKMVLPMLVVQVAELRNRDCSPGGATIMGTIVLELGVFKAAVIDAVTASAHRAEELGKKRGVCGCEMSAFTDGCDAV